MSPTTRTALLVGLVAVLIPFVPGPLVGILGLALIALLVVDVSKLRGEISLERRIPRLLSRGVPDGLSVEADTPAGATATIRQASPPEIQVEPSISAERLDASVVATRRGYHRLPGAAARVVGALGLVALYRQSDETAEVRVYPDMPMARRLVLAIRHGSLRDPGLRPRGPIGLGTEFESIRDYLPDDDIRQVNWRATARLGRPMSNQYRLDRDRDVILLMDCGRLMGAGLGDRSRLDVALDVVAAVSLVAEEFGDRCGVVAFDDQILASVKPRRRGSRAVIEAVYALEPSPRDSDYERAFREVERAKRAFVLVLTDLIDEAAAQPLLSAVPVLVRRHAVAVTTAADPDLDSAVHERPTVPLDAYRMAVARDVLAARSRAAVRLRAVGTDVIEAPASALPAASARAYVTAKLRARL